ncbi:hypothetical protein QTP88_020000 [Uroleucon formosanum]
MSVFLDALHYSILTFVPKISFRPSTFPSWYTKELKELVFAKSRAHAKFKSSQLLTDYKHFSLLRAKFKFISKQCYRNFVSRTESSLLHNPKYFWSFIRKNRSSQSIPSCVSLHGKQSTSLPDTANLFAAYFSSVFTQPSPTPSQTLHPICLFPLPSNSYFSISDVYKCLCSLRNVKSVGPDGIQGDFLYKLRSVLAEPLWLLFGRSIDSGIFPSALKLGSIRPILKSGDSIDVSNYRPITILPHLSKIFESLVLNSIRSPLNHILIDEQHGFRPGRSTLTCNLSLHSYIYDSFRNNCQVDVIYTDFSKAFDRVDHNHLMSTLDSLGIGEPLLSWFRSYITNRIQWVTVDSTSSDHFTPSSGVPQGAVLSPLLFALFVNSAVSVLHHAKLLIFADDMKIFFRIKSISDCHLLQNDLQRLVAWGESLGLALNIAKCSVHTNLPRISGDNGKTTGNWKNALLFGTWNVRTLFKTGAAQGVVSEIERYRLKVVALQEIRWRDLGSVDIQDTTVFYGKCNDQRQFGTGFAVHKSLIPAIKDFRDVNPRISILTLTTQWFDISFVNLHAPTEDKRQEEKDLFYEDVMATLNTIPRRRIQIILGDMNAKIGKETTFRPVIGSHSLHNTSNDNGLRLIDLATERGLVVKSTMFPHKTIHKGTWSSPDGKYINQIDHILINLRFSNCIQDVRTVRGADSDSDHFLVKGKIKVKLKSLARSTGTILGRYDVSKLESEEKSWCLKNRLNEQLRTIHFDSIGSIDERWVKVRDSIKTVSESVLGKPKEIKKPWFNEICEKALVQRKSLRTIWLGDPTNKDKEEQYKRYQKETHNTLRREKRLYAQKLLEEAEKNFRINNIRQLYQKINTTRGGYKKRGRFLREDDGTLVTEQGKLLEKWTGYFEKLLNCDDPVEEFPRLNITTNNNVYPTPSKQEIAVQIKRLKNHKSPGEDGIQAERG